MKNLYLGIVLGFCTASCAAFTFSYTYYGLSAASYDGKLLAVDPKKDQDLSICKPDGSVKGKCIVMMGPDFYALKQDFMDTKQKLSDCQRGSNSK